MRKERGVQIPYDVRYNVVCITPCMLLDNVNGNRPKIGSALCSKCTNFIDKDSINHVVTCRNTLGARIVGYSKPTRTTNNFNNNKKVICIETDEFYVSISEASRANGVSKAAITNSCKTNTTTKVRLTFKYYDGK